MSKKEIVYSNEVKDAYDRLFETNKNLDITGITILTGNNGSGKSLIRKQTPFKFQHKYNLKSVNDTRGMIKSTSMDSRTESRPEFGAFSSAMHDTSWVATSQNTFSFIKGLLEACSDGKTKYLIIDEIEIGCSEETILALAQYINEKLQDYLSKNIIEGALIITHSKSVVNNVKHDHFLNIEGRTEQEWINRIIIPTDLKKLDENELFLYIRDYKNL